MRRAEARPEPAPLRRKALGALRLSEASGETSPLRRSPIGLLDPASDRGTSETVALQVSPDSPGEGKSDDRSTTIGVLVVHHAGKKAPSAARSPYGALGEMALLASERIAHRHVVRRRPAAIGRAEHIEAEAERNERRVLEMLARGERPGEARAPRLAATRDVEATGSRDPDAAYNAIAGGASSGRALPAEVRAQMERAFGADFRSVRVHADGAADSANRALSARAFATGEHIAFRSGDYDPASDRGLALIAHELTHVVQQRRGGIHPKRMGIFAGDLASLPASPVRRSSTPAALAERKKHVRVPAAIAADPLGALCTLPNDDFWGIVSKWDAGEFSEWAWDGDVVRDPRVFARFRDVLAAQPAITRSPPGAVRAGWELALDLDALEVPKPAVPTGPVLRAARPGEKTSTPRRPERRPERGPGRVASTGQAGGEEADKHSKQRAVLAALTRMARRGRLAEDAPGLHFVRPRTTAELLKLTKVEFWAAVSRWDASTFAARIHDGKEIKDRALLNRLKECFGRKDSLKSFEETARSIYEHLTERKYGSLLHEAENAAWDGRTVGDVLRGGRGAVAGRAVRSVQKLEQAAAETPGFVTRMISRIAGFARDLFGKVERAISGLAETLEHAEQPWIRNAVRFVESLLAPAREMFETLGSRAGGWLESLKTIGGKFKTLAGRVFEFLGPWATRLAFLADIWSWTRGPRALAEHARDREVREDLERGDSKSDLIANLYYGPNVLADLVSVVGTVVPVVKPAGFAADLFNVAWGGIEVGWGRWKMSAGGVGLPLMDSLTRRLSRKRRGSSRFDDDDDELGRRYAAVLAREGEEPGVSLDLSTKYRLERILGRDLGEVRLHTGPLASRLARATEAEALTVGRDIWVPGTLDLTSPEGLGLLVHEATHVAQRAPATPFASPRSLGGGASGAVMEDVARSIESRFVQGERSRWRAPEAVHREAPEPSPDLAAPLPSEASAKAAPVQRLAKASRGEEPRASGKKTSQDPVSGIMRAWKIAGISQEEFLEVCTERLVGLLKDEITLDSERRETLRWNESRPSP